MNVFRHSPAWVYSQVTRLLGLRNRTEEHKMQWLGMTGEPVFRDLFLSMLRRNNGKIPWPHVDARFFGPALPVRMRCQVSSIGARKSANNGRLARRTHKITNDANLGKVSISRDGLTPGNIFSLSAYEIHFRSRYNSLVYL